jgi:hypothetical protein
MVLKRVSLTSISRFGLTQLVGTLDAIDDSFIRIEKLRRLVHRVGDFGLRLPGSDVHDELVDWISDIVHEISGIRVLESQYDLITWKPNQGSSLIQSGGLCVHSRCKIQDLPIVGAIPITLPTNDSFLSGSLIHILPNQSISSVNVTGKVVLRYYFPMSLPNSYLFDDVHIIFILSNPSFLSHCFLSGEYMC